MTREEAIKMLKYLATDTTGTLAGASGDYAEFLVRVIDALDMGIAALAEVEYRRSAEGGRVIWSGAANATNWLKQPYKEET